VLFRSPQNPKTPLFRIEIYNKRIELKLFLDKLCNAKMFRL
jgi:hypothetical protein